MIKQSVMLTLIVVTLLANVILGFELYTAIHNGNTMASPSIAHVKNQNSSQLYHFSFKEKLHIHVKKKGEYVIGIRPNSSVFNEVYVIIYFNNGNTISLSLNQTQAIVKLHGEEKLTIFLTGLSYQNISSAEMALNLVGFYYTPLNDGETD
ncbi:hypothetical protein [Acidianus sp. RZ1]|uniref:hypothetical protein n=1 Tax=Acidianus sp. RZ1 TaxID=1540082 RepID=UPI001490CD50|nr:hypothetical protein [Acidianus sp. RZ1]NON62819.1 hypothetical protein [Acidianus sp. RZ1]